jgi:hypothetical protein
MSKFLLTILAATIILGGCSTTNTRVVPEDDVVEVDPENMDYILNGPISYEPTPPIVVVGSDDNVFIQVTKQDHMYDDQFEQDIQLWKVTAQNTNQIPKCVTPRWRLLDFKYITEGPSEQFIPANSIIKIGEMRQVMWVVDGVPVPVPPSGYLADLRVRDVVPNAKQGEECLFLVDEDNIVKEEDIVKEKDIKEY